MYKTFMSHAKKLTNSPIAKHEREILQGVKHLENGDLAVTDSHRIYYARDLHSKGECVLTPTGSKVEGVYPEIHRLFPTNLKDEIKLDLLEMQKAVGIVATVARVSTNQDVDGSPSMKWEGNTLSSTSTDVSVEMGIPYQAPEPFSANPLYWLDALQFLRAMKYREGIFRFYGALIPFTISSPDGKFMALILPLRSH